MIFVLTGAGVSVESGLETFRDPGGLWDKVSVMDVASKAGFQRDPDLVYKFYNERRRKLAEAKPNNAHLALAQLARKGIPMALVTQNVDDLHERAGSKKVIHMHGQLKRALCQSCRKSIRWDKDLGPEDSCPACGGRLRPDVVWFGEEPYRMKDIERELKRADVFVSIGTSGTVYPAAAFVNMAKKLGAFTVELNIQPSLTRSEFDDGFYGPASRVVPEWVSSILFKRNGTKKPK